MKNVIGVTVLQGSRQQDFIDLSAARQMNMVSTCNDAACCPKAGSETRHEFHVSGRGALQEQRRSVHP
ncbi:hypothetical protein [Aquitalea sp. ASV11]|uniref:hypothetical protein n=1 Tax=Aquitalea sp. ASV11 TaxID=2795103 RepID=UPI0018EC03C6|nr:hypothetical protein [Aquitalea sp. ASV11]